MMYLLTFDETNDYISSLPEVTLWEDFDEAVSAALEEMVKLVNADCPLEEGEVFIDFEEGMLSIENFCEIFPISVSTRDTITWFGKERKRND